MSRQPRCPLTPALLRLLQACLDTGDICDRALAEHLSISPFTVKTQFRTICESLQVHSRFGAVHKALLDGWIELPSRSSRESAAEYPERDMKSGPRGD